MNKLIIVGNLTNNPVMRITQSGVTLCSFTVAVNRHGKGQQDADYFRVTAWRGLAENCNMYLDKGRKVAVTGTVSVSTYQGKDGKTYANLEVNAEDVEFLTPKRETTDSAEAKTDSAEVKENKTAYGNLVEVNDDELPF